MKNRSRSNIREGGTSRSRSRESMLRDYRKEKEDLASMLSKLKEPPGAREPFPPNERANIILIFERFALRKSGWKSSWERFLNENRMIADSFELGTSFVAKSKAFSRFVRFEPFVVLLVYANLDFFSKDSNLEKLINKYTLRGDIIDAFLSELPKNNNDSKASRSSGSGKSKPQKKRSYYRPSVGGRLRIKVEIPKNEDDIEYEEDYQEAHSSNNNRKSKMNSRKSRYQSSIKKSHRKYENAESNEEEASNKDKNQKNVRESIAERSMNKRSNLDEDRLPSSSRPRRGRKTMEVEDHSANSPNHIKQSKKNEIEKSQKREKVSSNLVSESEGDRNSTSKNTKKQNRNKSRNSSVSLSKKTKSISSSSNHNTTKANKSRSSSRAKNSLTPKKSESSNQVSSSKKGKSAREESSSSIVPSKRFSNKMIQTESMERKEKSSKKLRSDEKITHFFPKLNSKKSSGKKYPSSDRDDSVKRDSSRKGKKKVSQKKPKESGYLDIDSLDPLKKSSGGKRNSLEAQKHLSPENQPKNIRASIDKQEKSSQNKSQYDYSFTKNLEFVAKKEKNEKFDQNIIVAEDEEISFKRRSGSKIEESNDQKVFMNSNKTETEQFQSKEKPHEEPFSILDSRFVSGSKASVVSHIAQQSMSPRTPDVFSSKKPKNFSIKSDIGKIGAHQPPADIEQMTPLDSFESLKPHPSRQIFETLKNSTTNFPTPLANEIQMQKKVNRESSQDQSLFSYIIRTIPSNVNSSKKKQIIYPQRLTKEEAAAKANTIQYELEQIAGVLSQASNLEYSPDISIESMLPFNAETSRIRTHLRKQMASQKTHRSDIPDMNSNRAKLAPEDRNGSQISDSIREIVNPNFHNNGNYAIISMTDRGQRIYGMKHALSPLKKFEGEDVYRAREDSYSAQKAYHGDLGYIPLNEHVMRHLESNKK